MVAVFGEVTATPYFIYRLRDVMLSNPTGRRILRDRPRITSKTMDIEALRKLLSGTVGREYAAWLDREGVSPDTRSPVSFSPLPPLSYFLVAFFVGDLIALATRFDISTIESAHT